MTTIDPARTTVCTVIVTVDAGPTDAVELADHARRGLRRFAEFDGFVGGATHVSADGGRIVQYLQWRSEEDHLACMNDPSWADLPSSQRFMELVESGRATMDVRTYDVVEAVSDR